MRNEFFYVNHPWELHWSPKIFLLRYRSKELQIKVRSLPFSENCGPAMGKFRENRLGIWGGVFYYGRRMVRKIYIGAADWIRRWRAFFPMIIWRWLGGETLWKSLP